MLCFLRPGGLRGAAGGGFLRRRGSLLIDQALLFRGCDLGRIRRLGLLGSLGLLRRLRFIGGPLHLRGSRGLRLFLSPCPRRLLRGAILLGALRCVQHLRVHHDRVDG